jgi:hypothetical protein
VIVAFTVVMPILMLALMFFLADIESRHLTQRTRVAERSPAPAPSEGPATATA